LPTYAADGPLPPSADSGPRVTWQHRLAGTGVKLSTPFETNQGASCPTSIAPTPKAADE
jgi:peptide-methionine (S)-S-oxide reductase